MMQQLSNFDAKTVAGGDAIDLAADMIIFTVASYAVFEMINYFSQDNGGPDASAYAASVGYVG